LVPVGKDQEQHMEMARNYVNRFHHRYGEEIFPEPYAFNFGEELAKVPSLDGLGKMSKSENQMATLYLADTDDVIGNKIKKAKTDSGGTEPGSRMPDTIANLFQLMKLVSPEGTLKQFESDYQAGTIRYGDLKKELGADMVKFISPIREKAEAIRSNEPYLKRVMEQGAAKARHSAQITLSLVKQAMGLRYF
jgi:tryptophanyl-tRNA synthetase